MFPIIRTTPFEFSGTADELAALPNYTSLIPDLVALGAIVWWYAPANITLDDSPADEVVQWACRTPDGAHWLAGTTSRQPIDEPDNNAVRFGLTADEVLTLTGATFPNGDYTKMVVFKVDPAETGTSVICGDTAVGTATRHSLYVNTVAGGTIGALTGPDTGPTRTIPFDTPLMGIAAYDKSEKTTFLQVTGYEAVATAVGADEVTPSTACYLGAANNAGGSSFNGRVYGGIIMPSAIYSTDGATHTARADARRLVLAFADFLMASAA